MPFQHNDILKEADDTEPTNKHGGARSKRALEPQINCPGVFHLLCLLPARCSGDDIVDEYEGKWVSKMIKK